MKSNKLYEILNKKFILPELSDDWYQYMTVLEDYICDSFKQTNMGVMCDFTNEIKEVYTATFPSKRAINKLLNSGVKDAMLFVHHASDWDSRNRYPLSHISLDDIRSLKENRISIYCIHVPLDNFSEYSTGNSFAKNLSLKVEDKFGNYRGSKCGVLCRAEYKEIDDLIDQISKVVNHKVKLYAYGSKNIKDSRVAIITGGGNDIQMLNEVNQQNINVYVTGVTNLEMTKQAHDFAKEKKINIIGATHYSTEKFACIEMIKFFEQYGIESRFLDDIAVLEDL